MHPALPEATPSPYFIKYETLCLGGRDYRIRSLLDRQQFHDPNSLAGRAGISSASWPLFGLVWPSARMLAEAMQAFDLTGKRVLEVGCGLGLASLVMQQRGADVTASDVHPLAAAFMAENLRLNQLAPLRFHTASWADDDAATLGRFDLIIGSDVLYERDQPEALSGYLARHAAASAEVIIVDPDRGQRARFTRAMQGLGFGHRAETAHPTQTSGEAYKGRFLHYRRGNLDQAGYA